MFDKETQLIINAMGSLAAAASCYKAAENMSYTPTYLASTPNEEEVKAATAAVLQQAKDAVSTALEVLSQIDLGSEDETKPTTK